MLSKRTQKSNFQPQTVAYIRDLHARELMRLGWYRQWFKGGEKIQQLRERKAQHQAFLNDLLRKRGLGPAWYAIWFYYFGHLFGLFTSFLPAHWVNYIEQTLEYWILIRYRKYFKILQLKFDLRTMIEAVQLAKLRHNEPGVDVLALLERFIQDEEQLIVKDLR